MKPIFQMTIRELLDRMSPGGYSEVVIQVDSEGSEIIRIWSSAISGYLPVKPSQAFPGRGIEIDRLKARLNTMKRDVELTAEQIKALMLEMEEGPHGEIH